MAKNKRLDAGLATVLLIIGSMPAVWGYSQQPGDEHLLKELVALNEDFISAFKNHDMTKLKAMTAADYVAIDPYYPYLLQGPDTLAEEQTAWDHYFKPANGDVVLIRREAQPRVKRYGDIAILAYVEFETVKTTGQRVRAGRSGKCTFIYHKENGKWLLVNSHITPQMWPDPTLLGAGK